MLVDTGASVNVMPYSLCRKIGRSADDLIKTNNMLNNFKGSPLQVRGVLNVELTFGQKTTNMSFFVVDTHGSYLALLGRDWIHANCYVPSMMHQCLIQWNGDDIEVVHADESCNVVMAEAQIWAPEDAECLFGREDLSWSSVEMSKKGILPVLATSVDL